MIAIIVGMVLILAAIYFIRRNSKENSVQEIKLPPLSSIKSDHADRPHYGTASDPMEWDQCTVLPPVSWQVPICEVKPNVIWDQANYFSTSDDNFHNFWTVSVNNEPAFIADECNTGIANRSKELNKETFFLDYTENEATLRIEMTSTNNKQRIPYLALNNTASKTFTGNYGDGMHVKFDLDVNFSQNEKHLHFYHFVFVLEDIDKNIYGIWLYLGHPSFVTKTDINWNWPVKHSIYYPGSRITFWPVQDYNTQADKSISALPKIEVTGQKYSYDIDADSVIKTLTPHLANAGVKILGFELSIENEFLWSGGEPFGDMFTEMTISNLSAYK